MRRTQSVAIVLVVLLVHTCAIGQQSGVPPIAPNPQIPGSIVVVPEHVDRADAIRDVLNALGWRVVLRAPMSGLMVAVVRPGDEEFASALVRQLPGVAWAGRDSPGRSGMASCADPAPVMIEPFDRPGPTLGNDPDFGMQWYLENTGQLIVNGSCPPPSPDPLNTIGGTPGVDINIRKAWAITQGCEDIVVAVFDTGIQYEHPVFDFNRFFFPDLALTCPTGNQNNPYECCPPSEDCNLGLAIDTEEHGTLVASILGAAGNNVNSIPGYPEMAGVDLKCRILAVRVAVAGFHGSAPEPFFGAAATLVGLESIASDPTFAAVRVINMSYQFSCDFYASNPIWGLMEDAIDELKAQDRFVVVIATNFGDGAADIFCPAKWDSAITIAGVNGSGGRWFGYPHGCSGGSGSGSSVDFSAPARALLAADCDPTLPPIPPIPGSPCFNGGRPPFGSGTSGAAPQVSGVISLLLARANELGVALSWQDVYDILADSSRRGSDPSLPSPIFGWGLVDAYNALQRLEAIYYRPFNRADLTDHNVAGTWRFGIADGVVDCDDLNYFLQTAYPLQILEKADFTTAGSVSGSPGYGVPDGVVTSDDCIYYTHVLHPGGCGVVSCP